MPVKPEEIDLVENTKEEVQFHFTTNKQDLNQVINHHIESLKGPIDYEVLLKDDVELYGTIPIFTQNIQMKLTFEPVALDNGDLLLKQKSISIGELPLPVSQVLKMIRDNYQFPDMVQIDPKEEQIYIALQKMKLKSDLSVRVDEFNLQGDQIKFSLLVPTE
jgi:uncharacterized protein YpmS